MSGHPPRLCIIALGLFLGSCASTTAAEREANGIQTMALGGGFIAAGTLTLTGAAVGAGASAYSGAEIEQTLLFAGVPAALGAIEMLAGGLLMKQGRCIYLDTCDEPRPANVKPDAPVETSGPNTTNDAQPKPKLKPSDFVGG